MRKILILVILGLTLFSVGCKKNTPAANGDKFIMGLDDSFPPMGFRNEQNEIVGFDIDLAKEVSKRLNMELVVQPIDWASKELELNTGKITCIWNGLSVDPAREEAMTLSKPYLANKMVIVVKHDSTISKKDDLNGKTVGLQAGSTAVKALEKDPINKVVKQSSYENNIFALTDLNIGRVDAVIMDEVVARYMISKSANTYKVLDDALDAEYYAIAFKKGNTELKSKVEKALQDMIADGTAAEISKKWFGEDIVLK